MGRSHKIFVGGRVGGGGGELTSNPGGEYEKIS